MAFFLINKCQYRGCGQTFPDLHTLILHIESEHINFDPEYIAQLEEEHPTALPLSYVLKYTKDSPKIAVIASTPANTVANAPFDNTDFEKPKNPETETKEESEAETKLEDKAFGLMYSYFPQSPISTRLRNRDKTTDDIDESKPNIKPYNCSIPGCKKRYTTINGLKYHWRYGHTPLITGKTGNKEEDKETKENKELIDVANSTSQKINSSVESLGGSTSCSKLNTSSDKAKIDVVDSTESEED